MSEKKPNLFQEVSASLVNILATPRAAVKANIELDEAIAKLVACTYPGQAAAMIRELITLAQLGIGAEGMVTIGKAAEQSNIIGFEYGQVRHLGSSRTLQEIYQEEAR
jgi:hypothetical protein